MKGAPVRTRQEVAGHASITTTMRCMHMTKSATEDAIGLLEDGPAGQRAGNEEMGGEEVRALRDLMAEAHGNRTSKMLLVFRWLARHSVHLCPVL